MLATVTSYQFSYVLYIVLKFTKLVRSIRLSLGSHWYAEPKLTESLSRTNLTATTNRAGTAATLCPGTLEQEPQFLNIEYLFWAFNDMAIGWRTSISGALVTMQFAAHISAVP